jgi:acyl dehydratase
MSASVSWNDVEVGTELPPQTFTIDRATLVRYAGASGDFNVIHWNERIAAAVGLPNVIAHGMLTMALGGRVVTDWVGDPGAVVEYGVRFTRPVVVPDDDGGATIEVTGRVSRKDEDGIAQVTLTVRYEGATVLGKAQALVRLG